jgi:hypothetical protein
LPDEVSRIVLPLYESFDLFRLPESVIREELESFAFAPRIEATLREESLEPRKGSNQPADDEPGLIDVLAAGEIAIGEWVESVTRISQAIEQIGSTASESTERLEGQETFAGRLQVTRQMARDMEPAVQVVESEAEAYARSLRTVDPAIRALLRMVADSPDEASENADVLTFLNQLTEMADSARGADVGLAELIGALDASASASRDIRAPIRRLQAALRVVTDTNKVVDDWAHLRAELPL